MAAVKESGRRARLEMLLATLALFAAAPELAMRGRDLFRAPEGKSRQQEFKSARRAKRWQRLLLERLLAEGILVPANGAALGDGVDMEEEFVPSSPAVITNLLEDLRNGGSRLAAMLQPPVGPAVGFGDDELATPVELPEEPAEGAGSYSLERLSRLMDDVQFKFDNVLDKMDSLHVTLDMYAPSRLRLKLEEATFTAVDKALESFKKDITKVVDANTTEQRALKDLVVEALAKLEKRNGNS